MTVFFSNHVIGEIEKVSTNLLILSQGKVVKTGTIAEITKNLPISNKYHLGVENMTKDQLLQLSDIEDVELDISGRFIISTKEKEINSPKFLQELIKNTAVKINYFARDTVTLEDIFFEVVKGENHESSSI